MWIIGELNYKVFIGVIALLCLNMVNYARAEEIESKIEMVKNLGGKMKELRGKQEMLIAIGDRYRGIYEEYEKYKREYSNYKNSYLHFKRRYAEVQEEREQIAELKKKSGFFKFIILHGGKMLKQFELDTQLKNLDKQRKYYRRKMDVAQRKMEEKEKKMGNDAEFVYYLMPSKLKKRFEKIDNFREGIDIIEAAIDELGAEDKKLSSELKKIVESLSKEERKIVAKEVFTDYSDFFLLGDIIDMVEGHQGSKSAKTEGNREEANIPKDMRLDKKQLRMRGVYDEEESLPEFVKQTKKQYYSNQGNVKGESSSKPQFVQDSQRNGRDDYRIVAISVETVPRRYNNIALQKLKNLNAAAIIIRIRGEEHIIDGKEAVAILVEKGYFRNFPGVGLVATTKYDNFNSYSSRIDTSSDKPQTRTIFNALEGCEQLKECYRKWGKDLDLFKGKDPKTIRKILKNMEGDEYWERSSCAALEDRCRRALQSKGRKMVEDFDSRCKTRKMSPEAAKIFGPSLLEGE